jgi:putative transposase
MSKHRTHSPELKSKVAMEAISGHKTLQEIAADNALAPLCAAQLPVPPFQVRQWWKRQLLAGASEPYTQGCPASTT